MVVKRKARDNVESGLASLKHWWAKKYKLPPNHKLFVNQSVGDLNLEMFEDWLIRKNELERLLINDSHNYSVDQVREFGRELSELNKALNDEDDVIHGDALIDKWEQELEEGLTPNLNEGLNIA